MNYPEPPNYSKTAINRAGDAITANKPGTKEYDEAVSIINTWRISHAYPISTFVSTLRKKVSRVKDPIVAQRLKRFPTIVDKLSRHPGMELSRMQDIAGVRGVVNTIDEVNNLVKAYTDPGRFTHNLVRVNDYIECPKEDGYRGVHLVFKYHNTLARNEKAALYEGMAVELQLRTKLQHTWATAVETMGTLRNEAFKSSRGNAEWLEFFALASSAFAYVEFSSRLKNYEHLTLVETVKKMRALDEENRILEQIKGFSVAARVIHQQDKSGFYNLITLNTKDHLLNIKSFKQDELALASREYALVEEKAAIGEPLESVLVSVGRLKNLRQAYPNYFLDIKSFIEKIDVLYSEIT